MTIEWKAFWSAAGAVLALALAAIALTGMLWTPLAIIIAAVGVLAAFALGHVVTVASEMWRDAEDWQQNRVWIGTTAAAAAYASWTITAVLLPVSWQPMTIMAVALGLLSVSIYWCARAVEWRLHAAPAPQPRVEDDPDALLGDREKVLRAALRQAGLGFVRVLPGTEPLRSNAGRQFRVRTQSKAKVDKGDRGSAQIELTPRHMEALAIALSEITGRDVESGWVRLRKERTAGTYSITVTNRDLMAEVIEYVDDPTSTSITEPAIVGIEIDGREYRERLDQHGRAIGSSTSGKSSKLHLELAHVTRCHDAVAWVGGVQKLYDLVGPWLEPYHGTALRPPLDWVAHGQTDTLSMMAAAMSIARWRQRQPMARRRWRKIILYLDEFSFVAQSRQKIAFQGEWVDASWLASAMLRGAASGDVHVRPATQRSTVDHFGDRGGDVIANIATNSAFRSKDWAEIGRLTNDYKLPVPNWPGEYYLLSEGDPIHLKAPYIQTTDPSKPRLHDGATIADVSWARRHLVGPGLTEVEGLAAAGPAYAARHQVVDDRMMAYLTDSADAEDTEPDHGETYDAVQAQLAAIATDAGLNLEPKERRPDAILTILTGSSGPDGMTAAQITDALNETGDQAEADVVAATLSRMYNKKQIARVASGRYTALDQESTI